MKPQDIKNIELLLHQGKLFDALKELKLILVNYDCFVCKKIYDQQVENYKVLLQYFVKGVQDPNTKELINGMIIRLYEVIDYLKNFYKKNYVIGQNPLIGWLEIVQDENLLVENLLNKDLSDDSNLRTLFYTLLFTNKLSDEGVKKLTSFFESKTDNIADKQNIYKAILISALTISMLNFFDLEKFSLLFHLYHYFWENSEPLLWHRAIVGIILILYFYENRLKYFPQIKKWLSDTEAKITDFNKHIEIVVLQLIRAKETKNIIKEFEEEIYPEMQKLREGFLDKLNIDEIEDLINEEHPEWEQIFEEQTSFLDKMQQFSMKQLEGSDVFITAFENLKNFPFFSEPMNWFMPFYADNPMVQESLRGLNIRENKLKKFLENVSEIFYMCNSDKYSFVFNLSNIPFFQRELLLGLFSHEAQNLTELNKEDELLKPQLRYQHYIVQYVQDLYRFYNISPFKENFENVFELETDIYNSETLKVISDYPKILEEAANLLFVKKFYPQAVKAYAVLIDDYNKKSAYNYEHLAYAYQNMKRYDLALKYYEYAEFLDAEKKWIYKKIAYSAFKIGNYQKAMDYYKKAERYSPDDIHIQMFLGKTFLMLKDYKKALEYFFKIEYSNPNNIKIMRLIAWTYLLDGNKEAAFKYYNKIMEHKPSAYDYLNYGHILWIEGNSQNAAESYLKALHKYQKKEDFFNDFEQDKEILQNYGITSFQWQLMLDYIRVNAIL